MSQTGIKNSVIGTKSVIYRTRDLSEGQDLKCMNPISTPFEGRIRFTPGINLARGGTSGRPRILTPFIFWEPFVPDLKVMMPVI